MKGGGSNADETQDQDNLILLENIQTANPEDKLDESG